MIDVKACLKDAGIKGISSTVDRNVFDGSRDDLKKLILR